MRFMGLLEVLKDQPNTVLEKGNLDIYFYQILKINFLFKCC